MVPGTTELLIIFAVLVLLFGANKLPKLGGAIGESIKNFKEGIRPSEREHLKSAADKQETHHS